MYFGLRLGILIKIGTLRLILFLEYSYFWHYFSQNPQFFHRIVQFQPQGIPKIFLCVCKISAWYSYKHYSYKKSVYLITFAMPVCGTFALEKFIKKVKKEKCIHLNGFTLQRYMCFLIANFWNPLKMTEFPCWFCNLKLAWTIFENLISKHQIWASMFL